MKKQIDFSIYSSIKIGPTIEVEIVDAIDALDGYYLIGHANNLLISPNPPKLAILSSIFDYIQIKDGYLHVGAATSSGRLATFCKQNDIAGFEFLFGLPGSIGGLIKMNAGMKEWEIGSLLASILTPKGYVAKKDLVISYRYTNINMPIFEGVFEIKRGFSQEMVDFFKSLRQKHPKEPSCGSCFKNPKGDFAGRLLEKVGLKGYRINDIAFSQLHANFLINLNKATFDDAITLIELGKKRVFEEFGIKLEEEVIVL